MRFVLRASGRRCYKGHVDTFEIEGTDYHAKVWLGGFTLWCRTCGALVKDNKAEVIEGKPMSRENVSGYVISTLVGMEISEDPLPPAFEKVTRVPKALQHQKRRDLNGASGHTE